MTDPALDLAAQILRTTGRVAMTVSELADALGTPPPQPGQEPWHGTPPADLARRLREDGRFIVIETGAALPGLEAWSAPDRLAYTAALRGLHLPGPQLVLLRSEATGTAGPVRIELLLHATLIGLLELPDAPQLATAAEEAGAALARINPSGL
jgi:hypothetical protein